MCRFYVSDLPDDFTHVARMFLGREVDGDTERVDMETLLGAGAPIPCEKRKNPMDVLISITGTQRVDGEEETIELTTAGGMEPAGEGWTLTYDESAATRYGRGYHHHPGASG